VFRKEGWALPTVYCYDFCKIVLAFFLSASEAVEIFYLPDGEEFAAIEHNVLKLLSGR